jgi:hypothetical protein
MQSLEDVLTGIDADLILDESPEQKELEAALAKLDAEIAAGEENPED